MDKSKRTACLLKERVLTRRCPKQGHELAEAHQLIKGAKSTLGLRFPKLWLLGALYFKKPTFDLISYFDAHLLIKVENAEFREVLRDAQLLFHYY